MRPRQHEIETESRRQFAAILPAHVVERSETPDYGYDYTLEWFRDGTSTELRWLVQIKGKDEDSATQHSSRYNTARLAQYLFRARLPVMLIHYNVGDDSFRYMWADQVCAQLDSRSHDWYFQETASVNFSDARVLTRDSFDELLFREIAQRFHHARSTTVRLHMSWPKERDPVGLKQLLESSVELPFELVSENDAALSVQCDMVSGATAQAHIRWRPSGAEWHEVCRVPLEVENPTDEFDEPVHARRVRHSILLSVRCVAALIRPMARTMTDLPQLLTSPDGEFVLGSVPTVILAMGLHADGTLGDVLQHICIVGVPYDAHALQMLALARFGSSSEYPFLKAIWGPFLSRVGSATQNAGAAASAQYSAGNAYFSDNRWDLALASFLDAARSDPAYRSRSYWRREVAAALFELGRYRYAARQYVKAMCVGESQGDVAPRLADCLLKMGDVSAAARWFERGTEPVWYRPIWIVKRVGTAWMSTVLSNAEDVQLAPSDAVRDQIAVVASAPLESMHWYNLAVTYFDSGLRDFAVLSLVAAVTLGTWDAVVWAELLLNLVGGPAPDVDFIPAVLWAADDSVGALFEDRLWTITQAKVPQLEAPLRAVVEELRRSREALGGRTEPAVIRFLGGPSDPP